MKKQSPYVMNRFIVFRQEYPTATFCWRIAETINTRDGPRTRFCNGAWRTEQEVLKIIAGWLAQEEK